MMNLYPKSIYKTAESIKHKDSRTFTIQGEDVQIEYRLYINIVRMILECEVYVDGKIYNQEEVNDTIREFWAGLCSEYYNRYRVEGEAGQAKRDKTIKKLFG